MKKAKAGGKTIRSLYKINMLRINWKHMMDSMKDEMKISEESVIEEVPLTMENETMNQILS